MLQEKKLAIAKDHMEEKKISLSILFTYNVELRGRRRRRRRSVSGTFGFLNPPIIICRLWFQIISLFNCLVNVFLLVWYIYKHQNNILFREKSSSSSSSFFLERGSCRNKFHCAPKVTLLVGLSCVLIHVYAPSRMNSGRELCLFIILKCEKGILLLPLQFLCNN